MMKNAHGQNDLSVNEALLQIRELNMDGIIDSLGVQKGANGYYFDFFNRTIVFDHTDFADLSGGQVLPAIKNIFCQYFLRGSQIQTKGSDRRVTFREFRGAGPLFSQFAENTNKTIEHTFSKRLGTLQKKCDALYSMPVHDPSFDLSVRFNALPKVPVFFQFNDEDEILPANSALLFHDDAQIYLDLKSLATMGTYLTGLLIH